MRHWWSGTFILAAGVGTITQMSAAKRAFVLAISMVASTAWAYAAQAQSDYPTRPVHWITGFPPGEVVDLYARMMGQWLSKRLGQQFVIENRPGAGSNLATEAAILRRHQTAILFSRSP